MANGRIDSPPTYYQGRLFFGSADGWLYCVDATDGRLAWKFRAGPEERMLVSDGRVESVWPVHGSVLIENDTIYCLAGRSLFLDGGMYMSLLDPRTGKLIAAHTWDDVDPETGKSMQLSNEGLKMVPSNSDLLVSDGSVPLSEGPEDRTRRKTDLSGSRQSQALHARQIRPGRRRHPSVLAARIPGHRLAPSQLLALRQSGRLGVGRLDEARQVCSRR